MQRRTAKMFALTMALALVLAAPGRHFTASAEELFDINFSNLAVEDVVKTYAKWMGKSFLLTDKLKGGTITTYSERKVTKDEAWRVFEAILRANGYTIVPGDEINRIVPVSEAPSELIPTYSTDGLIYGRNSFSYVTRLFPLEHVVASEMKGVISKFLSKGADVMEYAPTNLLIITESSAHINRVIKILKELDVPSTEDMFEIIQVNFASAGEMSALIQTVLSAGGTPAAAARSRARRATPTPAATAGGGGIRIIPDERTNSLIVVGSKKEIEDVKRLLELLDVDVSAVSAGENIYVHYLQYADASEIAGTLSAVISGSQPQTSQNQSGGRTVGGSGLQQRSAQRQIETLQAATQAGGQGRTGAQAAGAVQTLAAAQFEADIRIVADVPTNSLLITATRRDYETLRKVIDKLDLPRRQVFVEAAILEVSVNDASSLGFSFSGAGKVKNGVVFGQQSVGGPPSPLALAGGDIASLAGLGGVTAGVLGPTEGVDLDGDGTDDIQVPTYGGLLSAAKSDRSINVLSTPTVLTSDNEQAQIIIANNVPIPTGQTVGTSGVTTSTISREDIGITLRITPQINEGDTLRLEIFVEISNVATGSFGIDINQSGIVTTVRSAETVISVKDRQPIVIGGLIQDSDNLTESKVPILGDIPLLGALFRSRETVKDKQNLIILLTPNIVRDHFDATRVMALEVENRKPLLETEVLRRWLEDKNTLAAQEAFRRPSEEDRLPEELEADELLITPEGIYTPGVYNTQRRSGEAEGEADATHRVDEGEPLGTLKGVRRRPSDTATGSEAAGPEEAAQPGPAATVPGTEPMELTPQEAADPEAIRQKILEERERRRQERDERRQQQQEGQE